MTRFTENFLETVEGFVKDERGPKTVKVYFRDRISCQASCNRPHVFLVKLQHIVQPIRHKMCSRKMSSMQSLIRNHK